LLFQIFRYFNLIQFFIHDITYTAAIDAAEMMVLFQIGIKPFGTALSLHNIDNSNMKIGLKRPTYGIK
jgi:hypothetical protein